MRRLADATKLQLPAIYRAFNNKQALLDEMNEAIRAKALSAQREGARIVGVTQRAAFNGVAAPGPRPPSSATPSAKPWNRRA
ncbi:hypothetical protein OG194_02205 [Streptomyces sp. NBC_01288]|uniref:hypothetical protein n=1 Tax=Streptomyces sp. NBC_01288 TaxID=2903814 RepID=UPI002E14EA33|nr:hypothetical protein OG194_02205 [Streptomyces sp. NBC_01288]